MFQVRVSYTGIIFPPLLCLSVCLSLVSTGEKESFCFSLSGGLFSSFFLFHLTSHHLRQHNDTCWCCLCPVPGSLFRSKIQSSSSGPQAFVSVVRCFCLRDEWKETGRVCNSVSRGVQTIGMRKREREENITLDTCCIIIRMSGGTVCIRSEEGKLINWWAGGTWDRD